MALLRMQSRGGVYARDTPGTTVIDAAGNRVSRDISRDHKRNEERRARSDAPYHNGVCSATTGQAVGLTRNQQRSQTRRAVECAVQNFPHTAARELCGQGRNNSILASPIRLAWRRTERTPNPQPATCAIHARSITDLRIATLLAHHFARKTSRLMYAAGP